MSIATEIDRLEAAKASIKTAIEGKGVTVPATTKLDGYAALIDSISGGGGASEELDSLIDRTITRIVSNATTLGNSAFAQCTDLTYAEFLSEGVYIKTSVFSLCSGIEAIIFRSSVLCGLGATNAFTKSSIADGTGYVYVPSALVDEYKAATNWAMYADQIRAIEDYPDITGG